MQRHSYFFLRLTALYSPLFFAGFLHAATLPQSYPLGELSDNKLPIDSQLDGWLSIYATQRNLQEMPPDVQKRLFQESDEWTQWFMSFFLRSDVSAAREYLAPPPALDVLIKKAEVELKKPLEQQHPLAADVVWLALQNSRMDESSRDDLNKAMASAPPTMCARKQWFTDALKNTAQPLDTEQARGHLAAVQQYEADGHRRRALDALFGQLSENARADMLENWQKEAEKYPLLQQKYKWLAKQSPRLDMEDFFQQVSALVRKKQCQQATSAFIAGISHAEQTEKTLNDVMNVGIMVERCYRQVRKPAGYEFWDGAEKEIERVFNDAGRVQVDLRLGYVYWADDRFTEAKKHLNAAYELATQMKNTPALAKAVFTLGRVAENTGDLDAANNLFDRYLTEFSGQEDFESALNAMVTTRAARKQWAGIIAPLEAFLIQQGSVPMDARPVGAMSFGIFWLGRSYLAIGRKDLAREMWRRLATEYYSTFYGALGHFLLEKSVDRFFALEPSRVRGFRQEQIFGVLPVKEQTVAQRTMALLKVGFLSQARCELAEMDSKKTQPIGVAKSLLLHATGEWLDAIKIYDSLPRSVRNTLPMGFERVLFPRRYEKEVKFYADKLGLDNDLVFALMRQESVFNKDALSPVGAAGLMQLMAPTAASELHSVSADYFPPQRKQQIQHSIRDENILRDPEINVMLGVHHLSRLLGKYRTPVFALAAYNASPGALDKWQRNIPTDDLLTFIERIPYKETRAYVKLILRNYFYYKRWYGPGKTEHRHLETVTSELLADVNGVKAPVKGRKKTQLKNH